MVCRVDESQLTGEADDVLKDANNEPLLLSGSKVLEGNGRALVIAVGSNSQAGIIAGLAQGPSEESGGLRQALMLRLVYSWTLHPIQWLCDSRRKTKNMAESRMPCHIGRTALVRKLVNYVSMYCQYWVPRCSVCSK